MFGGAGCLDSPDNLSVYGIFSHAGCVRWQKVMIWILLLYIFRTILDSCCCLWGADFLDSPDNLSSVWYFCTRRLSVRWQKVLDVTR